MTNKPTDFNDLSAIGGKEAVKMQLESSVSTAPLQFLSEDALAATFTHENKNRLRYCHDSSAWYIWDGNCWVKDKKELVKELIRQFCRQQNQYTQQKALGSANKVSAVEKLCRSAATLSVTSEVWDADKFLLGTPAGVIDLKTGALRPAIQEDYISKTVAVEPAQTEDCPRWLQFIAEATGGDKDLQRLIQQIFGYALTGDTREQVLIFIWGPGKNGKSVFVNVMRGVIGEYAVTAPIETFTATKSDRHPTELAMLKGARLVTASETESNREWAESRIKLLTGNDAITARFMRGDFFTYIPEFKLIIVGNFTPRLRNVDDAMRRRLRIVPFVVKPENPDPKLEAALQTEWPGILRWAINGCLDWQKNGLIIPASVEQATDNYFDEQDTFNHWIEECCRTGNTEYEASAKLFDSWQNYAERNGVDAGNSASFAGEMEKRGFKRSRRSVMGKTTRCFEGCSLVYNPESSGNFHD